MKPRSLLLSFFLICVFINCELDSEFNPDGSTTLSCFDNIQNGNESGIDCGGSECKACTFLSRADNGKLGLNIYEISDGYIVFGYDYIVKFDIDGNEINSIKMSNHLNAYSFADFHNLSGEGFFVIATNGEYADLDNDLNISNIETGFGVGDYVGALITPISNELAYVGNNSDWDFLEWVPLFPIGFIIFIPESNYSINSYTLIGGDDVPSGVLSKHYEVDGNYYLPITKKSPFSYSLFGRTQTSSWFEDTGNYKISAIAEGNGNNLLTFGKDVAKIVVREFNKESGAQGSEIVLCNSGANEMIGDMIKLDDGYLCVSVISENGCTNGMTLEGPSDIIMRKLSSSYTIEWEKIINIENTETVNKVIQTSDDGYLLTGTNRRNSRNEMYIVKTDKNGEVF